MRISFDLDDVLFVSPKRYETEPAPHFPFNLLFKDRLRKGTVKLIHELQQRGFFVGNKYLGCSALHMTVYYISWTE